MKQRKVSKAYQWNSRVLRHKALVCYRIEVFGILISMGMMLLVRYKGWNLQAGAIIIILTVIGVWLYGYYLKERDKKLGQ